MENFIDLKYLNKISENEKKCCCTVENENKEIIMTVYESILYELHYNCLYIPLNFNLDIIKKYLDKKNIKYNIENNRVDMIINFENIKIFSYEYGSEKLYYIKK